MFLISECALVIQNAKNLRELRGGEDVASFVHFLAEIELKANSSGAH